MTMNNQSPLIPQGSLLEQKNKGRARVKIAVFLVLAIHGLGLMALLMQGCKKQPDNSATATETQADQTNTPPPAFADTTNTPAPPTNAVATTTNATPAPPEPVEPPQPQPPTPTPTTPAPAAATDYVVAKGDTFSGISKKFHVSVKTILEANPSVEPTKLKIGQTIHIPAAAAASNSTLVAGAGSAATADSSGATQTYTVKSGDSLTKIASHFGVRVRALRSANNLKTDRIVVGQKLKIPGKVAAESAGATPASAATSAPVATPTAGQ